MDNQLRHLLRSLRGVPVKLGKRSLLPLTVPNGLSGPYFTMLDYPCQKVVFHPGKCFSAACQLFEKLN